MEKSVLSHQSKYTEFNDCFNCAILFNVNWLEHYGIDYKLSSISSGNIARMRENYSVFNVPLFKQRSVYVQSMKLYIFNIIHFFIIFVKFGLYPRNPRNKLPHYLIHCTNNIDEFNAVSSAQCLFKVLCYGNDYSKVLAIYNDYKSSDKTTYVDLQLTMTG